MFQRCMQPAKKKIMNVSDNVEIFYEESLVATLNTTETTNTNINKAFSNVTSSKILLRINEFNRFEVTRDNFFLFTINLAFSDVPVKMAHESLGKN